MGFAGKLLASDSASRGAEDEAIAGGQGGGMQAGGDGEKDGLQQERRDGDQGDAVLVSPFMALSKPSVGRIVSVAMETRWYKVHRA